MAATIARASRELKVGNEAAVDLDLVDRELPQIAQRRIARSEIVERNAEPSVAQLPEVAACRRAFVEHHLLGDLKLNPAKVRSGFKEHRDHMFGKGEFGELHR